MSKPHIILLKTLCWLGVVAFIVSAGAYGLAMRRLFAEIARPGSFMLTCGNTVTDSLGAILSLGTPTGFAAVVALGVLWQRHSASRWSVVTAAVLSFACTTVLVAFGVHFFRNSLPGCYLSDIVWWMRPVGRWLGV